MESTGILKGKSARKGGGHRFEGRLRRARIPQRRKRGSYLYERKARVAVLSPESSSPRGLTTGLGGKMRRSALGRRTLHLRVRRKSVHSWCELKSGRTKLKSFFWATRSRKDGKDLLTRLFRWMEEVRDFRLKYPPRARGRSTSATVSSGSDRYTPTSDKESGSDSEASNGKEVKQFDGELDKYLTRGRGAGYRTILEAERKTKALRKSYYRLLSEEWSSLSPRYKVGEGLWVYSKEAGVRG
jgi:hypothetical protein